MASPHRELLRPEDATSWEEFQARATIEQARCRGSNGSWSAIGRTVLAAACAFVAILAWGTMGFTHGSAKWVVLPFALIFTGLAVWIFGTVMRRGVGGSKRYSQLTRLSKEWQAKAERGEIPQTTPGGPKVWRDELGTGAGTA
jgi:hypothetical protein